LPGSAHEAPLAHDEVAQHTPSTQLPVEHDAPLAQSAPSPSSGTHAPALHWLPAAQSALIAHVVRHAVVPHAKVPQLVVVVAQTPLPLHVPVRVSTPSAQRSLPQTIVPVGNEHVMRATPSQRAPQTVPTPAPPQAARAPRGTPSTGAHVPTLPATSQASH
jgi:hypothetical protein